MKGAVVIAHHGTALMDIIIIVIAIIIIIISGTLSCFHGVLLTGGDRRIGMTHDGGIGPSATTTSRIATTTLSTAWMTCPVHNNNSNNELNNIR